MRLRKRRAPQLTAEQMLLSTLDDLVTRLETAVIQLEFKANEMEDGHGS